ncbi:hypothetical protein EDC65_1539 [Stella humosa]|uniref:Alpha/beta hydrolase family protein n=1 Tax=Stella humosa TaxID=94 RepID=A0A3N1M7Q5_9PROT|nr:alpha/beta hydrolase [Stella humosa]ROP99752.1 hypothetical protein EDC65_1539 [Stella humosa]BBK31021.1 hypothetical protein STHU_16550 [Stella humosa]
MRVFRLLIVLSSLVSFMTATGNDSTAQEAEGRGPGQRAPVARVGDQAISFAPAGGPTVRLPVFANRSIDRAGEGVHRAVIVLHGTLRNADTYLDGMVDAVAAAGFSGETLVVAPQFLADVDAKAHDLAPDMLRWTLEGWKIGAGAAQPPGLDPAASSSFAALDAVIRHFADRARFPGLRQVVIAGHSAGAQLLARQVPASPAAELLEKAGIGARFVIANPSSWLYFDRRRPLAEGPGFAEPDATDCAGFNRYRYGLEAPVPYFGTAAAADMVGRFLARDVVHLLGRADNDPRHRFLDRSCAARLQGPHRLARGLAYFNYLRLMAGDSALHHRLVVVNGVGHDNRAMFASAEGRVALFGERRR